MLYLYQICKASAKSIYGFTRSIKRENIQSGAEECLIFATSLYFPYSIGKTQMQISMKEKENSKTRNLEVWYSSRRSIV